VYPHGNRVKATPPVEKILDKNQSVFYKDTLTTVTRCNHQGDHNE